jgi:maltose O-acetyltransferase
LTEPSVTPADRLAPSDAAGARPRSAMGWVAHLRRRATAWLRGDQDLASLIAQGLQVGDNVYVAGGFYFDPGFPWLISIGDETTIGPRVTILTHDATPKLRTGWSVIAPVHIGSRVFVGANTIILPGTRISDDAIVGAGSVLRHDVPPGIVVAGNPAREVGSTADHTERHLTALRHRPRFAGVGPAGQARPAADERRRILDALGDRSGYVE